MQTILSNSAYGHISRFLFAQTDNNWKTPPSIQLRGFIDVFYSYDFNQPNTAYKQSFFYNHNRHNEFNINPGYIKLSTDHPKYRANFALQARTYPIDNYASEPEVLKNIYEGNAGFF